MVVALSALKTVIRMSKKKSKYLITFIQRWMKIEKKDIFSSNGIIFLFFILSMPFHFRLQCSSKEWTFISLYDSKESYIKQEKGQFWYQRISMSLSDGHEIQMCLIFFLYEVLFFFCVREKRHILWGTVYVQIRFFSLHI